jgi:hypothetical protein
LLSPAEDWWVEHMPRRKWPQRVIGRDRRVFTWMMGTIADLLLMVPSNSSTFGSSVHAE